MSSKKLCACCGQQPRGGEKFRKPSNEMIQFINVHRQQNGKYLIPENSEYRLQCYIKAYTIYKKFGEIVPGNFVVAELNEAIERQEPAIDPEVLDWNLVEEARAIDDTNQERPEPLPSRNSRREMPLLVPELPAPHLFIQDITPGPSRFMTDMRALTMPEDEEGSDEDAAEYQTTTRSQQLSQETTPMVHRMKSKRKLFDVSEALSNVTISPRSQATLLSRQEFKTTGSSPGGKRYQVKETHFSLPFKSARRYQDKCFICKRAYCLRSLPFGFAAKIFAEMKLFVPQGNLACENHFLENDELNQEACDLIHNAMFVENDSNPTIDEISGLLTELSNAARKSSAILNFEPESEFNNLEFETLTGLDRPNFFNLHGYVAEKLRNSKLRSTYNALGIFMIKIRLNLSHSVIAILFGRNLNKFRVSRCFHAVRIALEANFVPHHLGYDHVSREEYLNGWHTATAEKLFCTGPNQLIYIWDATYLYCQKSRNYKLQRRTYSGHKFRNLLKAMMIVSPNGKILSVEGLYYADGKNNDAAIFTNLTTDPDGFLNFAREGDVIVYDRGFRDCDQLANNLGFQTKMPHFLPAGQRQHTTQEANESRLVTRVRWIVEAANGRVKRVFKFFLGNIENSYIPHLGGLFKIACAILNAYYPPLKTDNPEDILIAEEMLRRVNLPNLMDGLIHERNLSRMGINWVPIDDAALPDFPRLEEVQLRALTLGVYQLKQAVSYTAEHFDPEGLYTLYYFQHDDDLLMIRINSRHSSSTIHKVWIHYHAGVNSIEGITGWKCECKTGNRNVGMCAHVASVVWYLSYARYLPRLHYPAQDLDEDVMDASTYSFYDNNESNDEDDNNEDEDTF